MNKSNHSVPTDIFIAGGGLAGTLLAYRLKMKRPSLSIRLVERGASLGGKHTWSFHEGDVEPQTMGWLRPLVTSSWESQEVRFPRYVRSLGFRYYSIRSEDLHSKAMDLLDDSVELGAELDGLSTLSEDSSAACVIDARGFFHDPSVKMAYQKFLGLDLELTEPHGLSAPRIMDATCEQRDGYRFFYVLPWSSTSLLIEDTRYSDGPEINDEEYRREIASYAERQGWKIGNVLREERGALPIPLSGKSRGIEHRRAATIGVRAGLFHATTGYSFADAVRVAEGLSDLDPLTTDRARAWLGTYHMARRGRERFHRVLNRMMFWGASPEHRYKILQRFYQLPEGLIGRFYASRLGVVDAMRILVGKPPIPFLSAVRAIRREAIFE